MLINNKILLIPICYSFYTCPMSRGFKVLTQIASNATNRGAITRAIATPLVKKAISEAPVAIAKNATKKVTEEAGTTVLTAAASLATAATLAAVTAAKIVPTARTAASIIVAPPAIPMPPPQAATISSFANTSDTSATIKSFLQELWEDGWKAKGVITGCSLAVSYFSVKTYNTIRNQLTPFARAQLDTLKISHESGKAQLSNIEKQKTEELSYFRQLEKNHDDALIEKTLSATKAYLNYCEVNNCDVNALTLPQEGALLYHAMVLHMALLKSRENSK